LFSPKGREALLASPEASSVLRRIKETGLSDPAEVMRLCLQALRIQHSEIAPQQVAAEFVATLPPDMPGIARPTRQVLLEMLKPPAREVILLGYELTDLTMVQLLADAASAQAEVIIICDRERGAAQRLRDAWPVGCPPPRLFQDREREDQTQYASMHAKCLLVDNSDLLITSANFTFHGLHGNIEFGVRLQGPPVAEARKVFSHLVEAKIVEELY
jgi:phosphatidylserine/phosphatidylglycerophosphate/cardiolipin synthase-like enzyme